MGTARSAGGNKDSHFSHFWLEDAIAPHKLSGRKRSPHYFPSHATTETRDKAEKRLCFRFHLSFLGVPFRWSQPLPRGQVVMDFFGLSGSASAITLRNYDEVPVRRKCR